MPHRLITISLLVFTLLNLVLFLFRDSFKYEPYSDYQSLYGSKQENLKKWEKFIYDYPAEELKEAKQITDRIIKNPTNSYSTIQDIASFIYNRFKHQMGRPSNALSLSSPLIQYKKLCASPAEKLWCGNYAQIFSFFCWSQGIVSRSVEIMKPNDHHVLNECFLPEISQWVMVDITNNLLLIQNKQGKLLDLIAFKDSLKKSAPLYVYEASEASVNTKSLNQGASAISTYYKDDYPLFYYHRIDNNKVYSAAGKVKRYLFPVSWYNILDNKGQNNVLFFIKQTVILLWIVLFFAFLVSYAKF